MSYWQTGMDAVGAAAISMEKLSQRLTRTPSHAKMLLVNRLCGFTVTFSVHFQSHSPFFEGSVSLCSSDWTGTDPAASVSWLRGQHQCTAKLPLSRPPYYSEFLKRIFLCTNVLPTFIYMHNEHAFCLWRPGKPSCPLNLEWEMVVLCPKWVLGTEPGPL